MRALGRYTCTERSAVSPIPASGGRSVRLRAPFPPHRKRCAALHSVIVRNGTSRGCGIALSER
eukprot:6666364-Prymnesium_polylepis.1